MLNVTHGGGYDEMLVGHKTISFQEENVVLTYPPHFESPRSLTQKLQSTTGAKIPQGHLTTVKNLKSLLSFSRKIHWNPSIVFFWSRLNCLLLKGFYLVKIPLVKSLLFVNEGFSTIEAGSTFDAFTLERMYIT